MLITIVHGYRMKPCQCTTMEANKDAKYILDNLFTFAPKSFVELKNINILVIGAGSFPSFATLINTLSSTCHQVNKINFTLIEPDQAATNRFKDTIHKTTGNKFNLLVHFSIHNQDIKSYLENTHDTFDLIYFEHPDVSILNALLEKTRLIGNSLTISMQESIPYLRKVIKNQSVIIGSFIFKGDLCETKSLLKFSLRIKMHIVQQRKVFFDGHYYSLGLIGIVDPSQLPNKIPKQLAKDIRFSTNFFGIFILTSLIIFLVTSNKLKTVSFFFVIAQLFYNRYGVRGLIVRFLLIIGQIIVLVVNV